MTDEQQKAIDNLRSGNYNLSSTVRDFANVVAAKALDIAKDSEDIKELNEAAKTIETVTKMVGLSPKESQVNVQINAVNGFEFIPLDEEDIKQLSVNEDFEDAEYESTETEETTTEDNGEDTNTTET